MCEFCLKYMKSKFSAGRHRVCINDLGALINADVASSSSSAKLDIHQGTRYIVMAVSASGR